MRLAHVFTMVSACDSAAREPVAQSTANRLSGPASTTLVETRSRSVRPANVAVEADRSVFPTPPGDGSGVWFMPNDLMTRVEADALGVGIESQSPTVAPSLVEEVLSQVELVTWPELQAVPVEMSSHSDPAHDGIAARAVISVRPVSALEDRWYALSLRRPVDGARVAMFQPHQVAADGRTASRFHPGSRPTVTGIRVCGPRDGSYRVLVELSERTLPVSRPSEYFRMVQRGTSLSCRDVPTYEPYANGSALAFDCDSFDRGQPFQIDVSAGIRSVIGPRELRVAHLEGRWDTAMEINEGCRLIREATDPTRPAVDPRIQPN